MITMILKMSAVTVSPPAMRVIRIITDIGTVYKRTMNSPYIRALNLPIAGFEDPLRKKDMVIGTIGKTHGVSNIASPQRIASIIRANKEEFDSSLSTSCISELKTALLPLKTFLLSGDMAPISGFLTVTFSSVSVGEVQ